MTCAVTLRREEESEMSNANPVSASKFGARVYLMDPGTTYVLQTVKRGSRQNAPYVVDKRPKGEGARFIDLHDDSGIAEAIRMAFRGEL